MQLPTTSTDLQIRFTDIDFLGHVSNNVYLQFFDMGRVNFFKNIAEQSHCPFTVVVRIEIDMITEINMDVKEVTVKTWCTRVGTKSMDLNQYLYVGETCVAKGRVVVVGFNQETRESEKLPEHWLPSE